MSYFAIPNVYSSTMSGSLYDSKVVVSANSCKVLRVDAYNPSTAYYLQIHNSGSLPVTGSVPVATFKVASDASFVVDYTTINGLPLSNGCSIVTSMSASSYVNITASATDGAFLSVMFSDI